MEDDKIINFFSLLKKQNKIGKSYLFMGDNFNLVKNIVKLINCDKDHNFCNSCLNCSKIDGLNHPDLFLVKPKTLSITIEDIKETQQFLRLKGFSIKRKTVIINAAETMGEAAANAFLKTLEEPPKNSLIIICSSKLEGLLPTIVSRCRKIYLPFSEQDISLASLGLVPDFLRGERIDFKDRNNFKDFIWVLIMALRDYMVDGFVPINNRLLKNGDCEIIFSFLDNLRYYSPSELSDILKDILKVYAAYSTINENLALNLIRMNLVNTD